LLIDFPPVISRGVISVIGFFPWTSIAPSLRPLTTRALTICFLPSVATMKNQLLIRCFFRCVVLSPSVSGRSFPHGEFRFVSWRALSLRVSPFFYQSWDWIFERPHFLSLSLPPCSLFVLLLFSASGRVSLCLPLVAVVSDDGLVANPPTMDQ